MSDKYPEFAYEVKNIDGQFYYHGMLGHRYGPFDTEDMAYYALEEYVLDLDRS
jgi:hypothetical protein